jgi:hypothetical protein
MPTTFSFIVFQIMIFATGYKTIGDKTALENSLICIISIITTV